MYNHAIKSNLLISFICSDSLDGQEVYTRMGFLFSPFLPIDVFIVMNFDGNIKKPLWRTMWSL